MAESNYDVVVVGGGPGGYVAAIRAAQLGQKTAVVEREFLGGICLNIGCIPTKALLRNAGIAELLQHGKEFGFSFENLKLDYEVAFKRSRQVSDRLVKGVQFLMKKNKIDVYQGTARLRSATQLEVATTPGRDTPAVGGQKLDGTLEARHIILATGSRPRAFANMPIDGKRVITYREALYLTSAPKRIVIVGAGAIGMEFAYIFRSFGAEVTVIEMLPHLLPLEDEETTAEIAKAYKKRGIKALVNARTKEATAGESGVTVRVKDQASGQEQSIEADLALIAIGVQANSDNLGLEAAGVATDKRGFVQVDEYMRTNVPNVYAIGDVTGKAMLAHVAMAMGLVASEHIAGHETRPIKEGEYVYMPRCVYCEPQVASLGMTEAQARAFAREHGREIKVGKFPFMANGKALGLGEGAGFVKIIADARYGEILGAHLVGPDVTELLPELELARTWELTPEEIARSVHAHPTLSEAVMEAAHATLGQAIHI